MKILIAVDETKASGRAAEFVEKFFDRDDVSLTAVNVARQPPAWLPAAPYGGIVPWPLETGDRSAMGEAYEREEERAKAIAGRKSPAGADVEVTFGDPVRAITAAAEDTGADLIVVGSRDKGFLQRLFSGSVSEDLVRESPRPVLVVH